MRRARARACAANIVHARPAPTRRLAAPPAIAYNAAMLLADRGRRASAALLWTLVVGCSRAAPSGPVEPVDAPASGTTTAPVGEPPPVVDQLMPQGWELEPPRWQPVGSDPRLVRREGSDELGFVEEPCAYPDHCGCLMATEHRYSRQGDRWKVVVITPQVEIRRVVVRGTCAVSCGVQAPPDPQPIRSLGAISPDAVEIVDQRPRRVLKIKTCTDPMPRP